jgi:hypothetical protein
LGGDSQDLEAVPAHTSSLRFLSFPADEAHSDSIDITSPCRVRYDRPGPVAPDAARAARAPPGLRGLDLRSLPADQADVPG